MKKLSLLAIILLLTIGGIPAVSADEPLPETAEDNWCYPGGDWDDGRCVTNWHWVCGWYMARYEAGKLSRPQILDMCKHLLPSLPQSVFGVSSTGGVFSIAKAGCFEASFPGNYFVTTGDVVQPLVGPLTPSYSDPGCTTLSGNITAAIAFTWANTAAEALTQCQGIGGLSINPQTEPLFYACFN